MIVTYESRDDVARSLPAVAAQLVGGDELVVVDNASTDGTAEAVAEVAPSAKLIRSGENEGFAAACNRGAAAASGDLLLLLNPDTEVQAGFREAIVGPLSDRRWAAWMGLVTRDGGALINTAGNVVHFAGFTWAGGDGRPLAEAPTDTAPVPSLSGACLAIRRQTWDRLGGFAGEFFAYLEDTDLSLRLRLDGGELGVEPSARVEHRYEFLKPGPGKWRSLERNRWSMLLRTYPGPLLALVFPALLLTELALIPISIAGGWGGAKLAANLDVFRRLPRLLGERRRIQSARRAGAAELARALSADLDSDYLGRAGSSRLLRWGLRTYWRVVVALLGAGASPPLPPSGASPEPRLAERSS